jgi:CHAT domain-containing protein
VWTLDGSGALHLVRAPVGAARLARLVAAADAGPQTLTERGTASIQPRRGPDPAAARRELYRLLVLPVEAWLPREDGRLLTIVPHGPLFRLSFAALRDHRGRYLVERYAMHYVPAAGVLRFSAEARARAAEAPPRVLLVADPAPLPAAGAALRPLPAARAEVDGVRSTLGRPATRLVAGAATEADVVPLLAESTTVHFATHGVVDDEHSLDSFVALGRTGPGAPIDGRLTVAEVYDLRLRADLVFLSACRSGRGRVTGDGILGLTRAFLSAGAATVVATLWDVADEPSSQLVKRFYSGLARDASKSRALREAQLGLIGRLRSGKVRVRSAAGELRLTEDPALWAAFVVVGEP